MSFIPRGEFKVEPGMKLDGTWLNPEQVKAVRIAIAHTIKTFDEDKDPITEALAETHMEPTVEVMQMFLDFRDKKKKDGT